MSVLKTMNHRNHLKDATSARAADGAALKLLYSSEKTVRIAGITQSEAESLFARTIRFVCHFADRGQLLDVGCGSGWLSYLLACRGFEVGGIDLDPSAFETPARPNLRFRQGNATAIPFAAEHFDVVIANTVLEHIAEPDRVLLEMARVLKPGGLLFITGPNLVALGPSMVRLLRVWRHRPFREIFFRTSSMPRFPFGTTLPETIGILTRNLIRISRKMISHTPRFEFREPDLRPPFHADNDAIYLCNPIDVCRFLVLHGFEILRDVDLGRGRWTKMLAGGTWIAARKSEVTSSGNGSGNSQIPTR